MKDLKPIETEIECEENLLELIDLLEWSELEDNPESFLEDDTLPPEYYFSNPDPYFKPLPVPPEKQHHNVWFNEDGHLHTKNLSAW